MSKPVGITPAQEAQLRKNLGMQEGADLTHIYEIYPQALIEKKAGIGAPSAPVSAAPKPTVSTPSASAPKQAAPASVISTPTVSAPKKPATPYGPVYVPPSPTPTQQPVVRPAPTKAAVPYGPVYEPPSIPNLTQVQPQATSIPRATIATGSTSQEKIDSAMAANQRAITDAMFTVTPSMALTPEQADLVRQQAKRLSQAPRTPSGEIRVPVAQTVIGKTGEEILQSIPIVGDIAAGLAPQIIESAQEKKSRDEDAYRATQSFFQNNPGFTMSPENFQKVYGSYRYHAGLKGDSPIEKAARDFLTSVSPTGAVIESPLTTATKAINVGESTLVTVPQYVGAKAGAAIAERPVETPTFRQTLRSNIASGANLMSATSEGAKETARYYFDASPEVQDLVGNLGGVAGFGASLLIPIDLGIGSAGAGALRTGEAALKIGETFGEAAPSILAPAARGAIQGGFDAWRLGGKSGVQGVISDQLKAATDRWMTNTNVNNVVDTTISLAAEDSVQAAIAAEKKAGTEAAKTSTVYDNTPYLTQLETAFNDLKARSPQDAPIRQFATFNDYVKEAERFGIDIKNSAGKRAFVSAQPPENVISKEAKEALKKTSVGTSTVDYFDDLSSGGRSSLYYDAFLNTLSDAQKEKLLAGGSLKSSEFYGALDKYVNDLRSSLKTAGRTEEEILSVLQKVERDLANKGIKVPEGRVLGKEAGTQAYRYGGLIVTDEIKDALKNSYKIDLARRLKNSLAEKTGITGNQIRIGNIVLSKEDAASAIASARKKVNLESIMNKIKKGGGIADVSESEIKNLKDYFITRFGTLEPAGIKDYRSSSQFIRPTEFYSPFNVANDITRIERTGKINTQQYNNLIQAAIALEASSKTSTKTIEKVSQIAGALASEGIGLGSKQAELSYFLSNVMSPKDLQQTGIVGYISDISKKIITPKSQSIVANEIIMDVNAQLASLPERFKIAMRRAHAKTGSNPESFAMTMIEEFTQSSIYKPLIRGETGGIVQVESAGVRRGFPIESIEAVNRRNAGSYEMFRTYIASIYGGYEQTIDAIATTGRTLNLDDMAITTKEMRDLISVVIETPFLKSRLTAFQTAIAEGKNIEALNILQRTHIDLYGYSLQQVLTRKSMIPEDSIRGVLEAYTKEASNQVSNGSLIFYSSGKAGAARGIDEAYKAASQQAPIIKPSNFKEMLVGSYFSKAQSNIVDEALFKAQSKYPELFPSDATIKNIAEADWNTTRNAIIYNIDNTTLDEAEQAVYQKVRDRFIDQFEIERVIFTADNTKSISSFRTDMLVAAIEDNVSMITGGKGPTKKYLNTLMESGIFHGLNNNEVATMKKLLSKILDGLDNKPGSVYNQLFNESARADATVLFYQTALTNIRNQLKNPFSASLQGVAEKIQTIPLLVAEQASLKRPLFGAANLKSITETISGMKLASSEVKLDQVIAKHGEQLSLQIRNAEDAVNAIATSELSPEVMALAKKKEQVLADIKTAGEFSYRRWVTEALLTVLPDNGVTSAMSGMAKNGLLGGLGLPNIIYMMGNHLTGPSLIATTIGLGGASTAMKSLLFLDRDVNEVLKAVYAPYWAKTDRVLFTAPDGTMWTRSMLTDIVSSGSIGRSQAQAELSNQLIASAIDWAGKTGLYGDKNAAIKFIRRNFVNLYDMNVWSSLANGTDQMYRTSMLIRGLKNGETLEGAKTLAREALFDYGNLSQFEKDYVSKVFWFWTFRRNSWKAVFTALATDSRGLKAAFATGNGLSYAWDVGKNVLGMSEEDLDMRYAMKDYSESRMFLDLIEHPEFKKRYGIFGPPIPAKQAVADMIDYISIPFTLAAYERGLVDNEKGFIGSGVDLIKLVASQSNPAIQAAASIGFGLDLRTGSDTTSYLDPKLMWYAQLHPEVFYTFTSMVGIEAVPFEDEKPGVGYYDGRQWRIKNDDYSKRAWAAIKTGFLAIGIQRTMSDYAPILEMVGTDLGLGPATTELGVNPFKYPEGKVEQPIQITTGSTGLDFWRNAGVITAQDAPMIEEIQKKNREAAAREVKGMPITSGGAPQGE